MHLETLGVCLKEHPQHCVKNEIMKLAIISTPSLMQWFPNLNCSPCFSLRIWGFGTGKIPLQFIHQND